MRARPSRVVTHPGTALTRESLTQELFAQACPMGTFYLIKVLKCYNDHFLGPSIVESYFDNYMLVCKNKHSFV